MSNDNWLSRKFILSVTLMVIATLFIFWSRGSGHVLCTQSQYLWVISATLLPFLAANAVQDLRKGNGVHLKAEKKPSVLDRIKALIGTVFILSYATIIGISVMNYFHIVNNEVWFPVVTAVVGFYNVGNVVSKLNPSLPETLVIENEPCIGFQVGETKETEEDTDA